MIRYVVHLLAPGDEKSAVVGTNTWLVSAPSSSRCIVVDPGRDSSAHLAAIASAAGQRGWTIAGVLLTHGHEDHSTRARELAEMAKAPVLAYDSALARTCVSDGDRLDDYGVFGRVIHTPWHSDDSICIDIGGQFLLTGDTLLGGHSCGVYGDFGDYIRSLQRLIALTCGRKVIGGLPGHGTVIPNAHAALERVLLIRQRRVDQIRAIVAQNSHGSAEEFSLRIYPIANRRYDRPSAVRMIQSIAGYLLDHEHDARGVERDAYARLAAEPPPYA